MKDALRSYGLPALFVVGLVWFLVNGGRFEVGIDGGAPHLRPVASP